MRTLTGEYYQFHCHTSESMSELADGAVTLTVTAPPYWQAVDSEPLISTGTGDYTEYIDSLVKIFSEVYRVTEAGGSCAIVVGTVLINGRLIPVPFDLTARMSDAGWQFQEHILWDRTQVKVRRISTVMQRPYPGYFYPNIRADYILIFRKPGPKIYRRTNIDREGSLMEIDDVFKREIANNVWHIQPISPRVINHPCPFPEEIPYRLISMYSYRGDTVLDPFVGSGQTIKVAATLGRNAVGYDTNPRYIEYAQSRVVQPYQRARQLIPRFNKVPWAVASR